MTEPLAPPVYVPFTFGVDNRLSSSALVVGARDSVASAG